MDLSCNYTSWIEFLNKTREADLGIASTIEACPNVCRAAWGPRNQDLYGAGAFASYTIQATLTVILGPLLAFARHKFFVEHDEKKRDYLHGPVPFAAKRFAQKLVAPVPLRKPRTNRAADNLQYAFLDCGIVSGLAIAYIIMSRMSVKRNQDSLAELDFVNELLTMQLLSMMASFLAAAAVVEDPPKETLSYLDNQMILFGVMATTFYLVPFLTIALGLASDQADWRTMAMACESVTSTRLLLPTWSLHVACIAGHVVLPPILIWAIVTKPSARLLCTMSAALAMGSVICTVNLGYMRSALIQENLTFQANDKGSGPSTDLGQYLVLVLWAPVVSRALDTLTSLPNRKQKS